MSTASALRILVVDDDPIQLRVAVRVLRELGCAGALANRGETALELLDKQAFDAVLLDLRMPGLSGLETLARLRAKHPTLPVVFISGDDLGANWAFYEKAGANGYLTKPLDMEAFSALLGRQLRLAPS
ncbi:MAG: response regulator [Burkholderiaceae bacterium]